MLIQEDMKKNATRYENAFAVAINFAMLVTSQTGFGDMTAYRLEEQLFGVFFFIAGTLTFCYLVADYSATLMLANDAK